VTAGAALRKVVLGVAPNGGRKTRDDHPRLPTTAAEVAQAAAECLQAGASMLHLHVRDSAGRHILDADAYRSAIARVCQTVGDRLVLQIASESLGHYPPDVQMSAVLETNPEAASIVLRELAPEKKDEWVFADFLSQLKKKRIWPQIILYSPEDAARLGAMHKLGMVPFDEIAVLYVLGRYSLLRRAAPSDLLPFLAPDMPRFSNWSVCAFGRREAACATAAALLGGHARVGFENNLSLPSGDLAASNTELVRVVAEALDGLGFEPQSADGLREEIAMLMR
jgi:uncharacterized protein (DUF849 family)